MADLVYLLNNARFLSATEGTGAYGQGATPTGYLAPAAAGAVSGRTYTWKAESEDGATWELFYGKWTAGSPPTVTRDALIRNSAGGTTAINWPPGVRRITCVVAADEIASRAYADSTPLAKVSPVSGGWDGASPTDPGTSYTAFFNTEMPQGSAYVSGGVMITASPPSVNGNLFTQIHIRRIADNSLVAGPFDMNIGVIANTYANKTHLPFSIGLPDERVFLQHWARRDAYMQITEFSFNGIVGKR